MRLQVAGYEVRVVHLGFWLRVKSLKFRVRESGSRVQGLVGFRAKDVG
jgi:hypothetical protein